VRGTSRLSEGSQTTIFLDPSLHLFTQMLKCCDGGGVVVEDCRFAWSNDARQLDMVMCRDPRSFLLNPIDSSVTAESVFKLQAIP
jgi:UTP:GlnB (protein PII) uridylyltransferase